MKQKYLYSLGVSFYAEKEMMRLAQQARKGWQFVKMNQLGFLVFKKAPVQEKQFAVDFYTGNQSQAEIDEYLEMYEASGWTYVSNYQKRYFYFMADPDTPTIFSDKVSYAERLEIEQKWLMKNSFKISAFGLLILIIMSLLLAYHVIEMTFFSGFFTGGGIGLLLYPLIYFTSGYLLRRRYKDRSEFFNNPEAFAKKQRFWLDTLFNLMFGAIMGGMIGFIFGYFF